MEQTKESEGFMFIATRPCGKISAYCWDDEDKYTDENVSRYRARGDTVIRVEVFDREEVFKRPTVFDCECAGMDCKGIPENES
jgi:hypothetical protein